MTTRRWRRTPLASCPGTGEVPLLHRLERIFFFSHGQWPYLYFRLPTSNRKKAVALRSAAQSADGPFLVAL